MEKMGILLLIDVVNYTPQSVEHRTKDTKRFNEHLENVIISMAENYNAFFIKRMGDSLLLFFESREGFSEKFIDFVTELRTASKEGMLDKFKFICTFRMVSHFGVFNFNISDNHIIDFTPPEGIQIFRMEKFAKQYEVFISDYVMNILGDILPAKNITLRKVFDGVLKGFNKKIRFYKLVFQEEMKKGEKDILKNKMEELEMNCREIRVFGDYHRMRMEDNFINLDISPHKEKILSDNLTGLEEVILSKKANHDMDSISVREHFKLYDINDEQQLYSDKQESKIGLSNFNVEKLYENNRKAMIFGLPGSGKTTTLFYFAFKEFQYNRRLENTNGERVVLFVSCCTIVQYDEWFRNHAGFYGKKTQITKDSVESYLYYFLHEFLFHQLPPKLKKRVQNASRQVLSAFSKGNLTLLVDALDEAHSRETKEGILKALRRLFQECIAGKKDANRLYLTARFSERDRALPEKWEEIKVPVFWVRSLDMEQLRQMAGYFYRDDKALYKEFYEAVWKEEIAAKVGGTPLTALLVLVYFKYFRTFDSRFEMYNVLLTFILARAWKHIKEGTFDYNLEEFFKDVKNESIFIEGPYKDARVIYDALSLLAYSTTNGQFEDVKEQEILAFFIKLAADLVGKDQAEEEAKKWLSRLKEDHVLIPAGPLNYVFIHHTIMEYLAARFIKEELKDPTFLCDKFQFDSIELAIMNGKEPFFQSEMIPIAVGSAIETGASLMPLIHKRISLEKKKEMKEIIYLTSLKCLAEWESYFDRRYRQLRHEVLQDEIRRKENENEGAVEWIYKYLKEILESKEKQVLKAMLDKSRDIPHLTRSILIDKYLSPDNFFPGDSETIHLRKELLERFVTKQEAKKWFKQHEETKWKVEYPVISKFDSEGYHPDDKNFNYYLGNTSPTFQGLLGSPNFKHSHCVNCVTVSPDGKSVVSGSDDKTLKWWELESGKEISTFKGHNDYVKSVAFSPDGKRMISGSDDNTIKLWDLESGKEKRTFKGHEGPVNSIAISPDGNTVVSGSSDSTLKWWDLESGKEIQNFKGHERPINSIAFSPDGKTVVSGSSDKTIKLWNLETGQEIRTFRGHTDVVKNVVFSPDGKTIISASWDKTIKRWDLETGQEIQTLKAHDQPINSIDVSPDGNTIVSASWDKTIKWWNIESRKEISTFIGHTDHVNSVNLSPDSRTMVSGSRDDTLRCWQLESGKEIKKFRGHEIFVNSISFSPDGKTVVSGSRDFTLRWWDLESGKEKLTFMGHRDHVNSVCFSPDGKTIVSGAFDKTLKWWDIGSGKVIQTFRGHEYGISAVCFSPDGKTVVSGSFDNTLKLWDMESGKVIKTFIGHGGFVWSVGFSPDGKTVVSGSDDKTLKLWDLESGKVIKTFEGHEGYVYSVNFSSNGQTVVSGSSDQTLKLWDLKSGKAIRTFKGHEGIVWNVVFSPDGKYIISCSWDYTIKIWEKETGNCIATVPLLWIPKEIKPSPVKPGLYACANGNGTIALFDFTEIMENFEEKTKKWDKVGIPSKIASPSSSYSAPGPISIPHPEPIQRLKKFTPKPGEENAPFTLRAEEKTWLTTFASPLFLPTESRELAGYIMLYSLYYWESDLDTIRELGIIPSLQREYERLFEIVGDLLQMIYNASPEDLEQEKARILITRQSAANFLYRFSNSWKEMSQYFPWQELNQRQVAKALGKLKGLLHRLKRILSDIRAGKSSALKNLEEFLRDISPLVKLMERLSEYTIQQDKSEPIPRYVAGEIKEITDRHLIVTVERSGYDDEERKIPRQDFPDENPQVGQHFFAVIEKAQPDKLVEIEPLPVKEESFEDILRSLFGKEAYEKMSSRWGEEEL